MVLLRCILVIASLVSSAAFAQPLEQGEEFANAGEQFQTVENFTVTAVSATEKIMVVETSRQNFKLVLKSTQLLSESQQSEHSGIEFYSGTVAGDSQAWVRVTIKGQKFYALIRTADGYVTLSNYDEPLAEVDERPDFRAKYTVIQDDVVGKIIDGESFTSIMPMGIVIDHLYNEKYDYDGVARALGVVNGTDGIMRENLGLALRVDAIVIATDEDFSLAKGASSDQLRRFRSFRDSVPELPATLGTVYLFSGAARNGERAVGRAYVSTVCMTNGLDTAVSVGWWRNTSTLMAHELGHNFGSRHDNNNSCSTGPTYIMRTPLNSSRVFSSCSLDQIRSTFSTRSCFIKVYDLTVEARRIDQAVVVQITNNSETEEALDISLGANKGGFFGAGLPDVCSAEAAIFDCIIPSIAAGETIDLTLPIVGRPTGEIEFFMYGDLGNGYETDLSDNSVIVNLSRFTGREGLCIDPDGDGFGWNGTGSCRTEVVARDETEERPNYINVQTGIPPNLVQGFWNPAEFTGQVFECVPHYWSSDDRYYKEDETLYRRYRHELAEGETSKGTVQVATFVKGSEEGDADGTSIEIADWSIVNGRYEGPAPIGRSSYIQIVDEGGNRFNATRSWTSDISWDLCRSFPEPSGYFVPSGTLDRRVAGACVDTPPLNDGFGWNGIAPCKVDPDLDVTGSRSLIVNTIADPVTIDGFLEDQAWQNATAIDTKGNDLRMGTTIFGVDKDFNGTWYAAHDASNIYLAIMAPDDTPFKDSANELWHDDSVEIFFDAGYQRNKRYDPDDTQLILRETARGGVTQRAIDMSYVRRYDEENTQYIYEIRVSKADLLLTRGDFGIEVQINDDQDGELRDHKSGWAALDGVDKTWYDMTGIGHACFDSGGATENCLLSGGPSGACVDTPPLDDGWGWNGTESCRIGGDPKPPEPEPVVCKDTPPLGDGWGWNGTESCRIGSDPKPPEPPEPAVCKDTPPLGDGWGWNGTESCRVVVDPGPGPEPAVCKDTPPLGDGWGWNGTESCRVVTTPEPVVCTDTPPLGDGWGWNGTESCRVVVNPGPGPEPAVCKDTPPLGDGWGWNGTESCRVVNTPDPVVCKDTPPLGNGWGWNGTESCRVQ